MACFIGSRNSVVITPKNVWQAETQATCPEIRSSTVILKHQHAYIISLSAPTSEDFLA